MVECTHTHTPTFKHTHTHTHTYRCDHTGDHTGVTNDVNDGSILTSVPVSHVNVCEHAQYQRSLEQAHLSGM